MIRNRRVSIALFGGIAIGGFFAALPPPAARAACPQWNVSGHWRIVQSNDTIPRFTFKQTGTTLTGNGYFQGNDPETNTPANFTASVSGVIDGNSIGFTAYWNDNAIGHYSGTINRDGRITGTGFEERAPNALVSWYSKERAECLASSSSALSTEDPNAVKPQKRIKLDPSNTPLGSSAADTCERARRARARNSPAAPGLEKLCLEKTGGGEATQEISE